MESDSIRTCLICGKRIARGAVAGIILCRDCIESPPVLTGVMSLCRYHPKAKSAIHSFKYLGNVKTGKCLGAQLALLVAQKAPGLITGKSVILPVPLSLRRELTRGFNQSAIMAQTLSQLTGIPMSTRALKRKISFTPSARLPSEARKLFVRETFRADPLRLPQADHIILLDDVATTLSTLNECARELIKHTGPEVSIWGLTVARSD